MNRRRWNARSVRWLGAAVLVLLFSGFESDARAQFKPTFPFGPLDTQDAQQGGLGGLIQAFNASRYGGNTLSDRVNVFVRPDRGMKRLLDTAEELCREERFADAVRCLGEIIQSEQDYFLDEQSRGTFRRTLRSKAFAILGAMPSDGRRLHETQYGSRARRMLEEASARGDVDQLALVSRRFFHTEAGYEATFVLGLHLLDSDRPLAGAFVLKRLRLEQADSAAERFQPLLSLSETICWLRADQMDGALEAIAHLKAQQPEATITVAAERMALFSEEVDPWLEAGRATIASRFPGQVEGGDEDDPTLAAGLARLASFVRQEKREAADPDERGWAMFRGDPRRNASAPGGEMLLASRWATATSNYPHVRKLIDEIRRADHLQGRSAPPSGHPLVVGDRILVRGTRTLRAIDFSTGKLLWQIAVDSPFEDPKSNNQGQQTVHARDPRQLENDLRGRMWGDATFGTLGSDGQRVYSIEDLPLSTNLGNVHLNMPFAVNTVGTPTSGAVTNRLIACDIETGKLAWQVGGDAETFDLSLAGAFFLGPPLCLQGRLYAVADLDDRVQLLCLDAATGKLLWSRQLVERDQELRVAPVRRIGGCSPSYSGGILVCPTSNDSLVAVELATRSLLWGASFALIEKGNYGHRQAGFSPEPGTRWCQSDVILAEGCVLVTLIERNELRCASLFDGTPLWSKDRGEGLYVACVHRGKVIVVGSRNVTALDLGSGEPASDWQGRTVDLPERTYPSGMGFANQGRYYLPLDNASLMIFDLQTGEVLRTARSRRGQVPGNLVCYRGQVISQRADVVEIFHQIEPLRQDLAARLTAEPADARALALEGEILWQEGKIVEAMASLRRSNELKPTARTRQALREVLFEGLDTDFASHRQRIIQAETLLDTPTQRARLARLVAVGLEEAGEIEEALAKYIDLIAMDREQPGMEQLDADWSVSRSRWLRMRLGSLHGSGSEEVRRRIDEHARESFATAWQASSVTQADGDTPAKALERFIRYYGEHPLAEEARDALVEQYRESDQLLPVELLLLSPGADLARWASGLAQTAEVLREADHSDDAYLCYGELAGRFAEIACRGDQTGAALVASLPEEDPARRRLASPWPWPEGRVEIEKKELKSTSPGLAGYSVPVPMIGPPGPFHAEGYFDIYHSPFRLVARDGCGQTRWELPLDEVFGQGNVTYNRRANVMAVGHLLLMFIGDKVVALDTLEQPDRSAPKVLWIKDANNATRASLLAQAHIQQVVFRMNVAGGQQFSRMQRSLQAPVSRVVSGKLACFRRDRFLVGVDPLEGEVLWQRDGILPDTLVFGDDEYLFLKRPDDPTATVLRASDGKVMPPRVLPMAFVRIVGRNLVRWTAENDRLVLSLFDPWTRKSLWPDQKFAANAVFRFIDNDRIAVCEPKGRFVVIDLGTGKRTIDSPIRPAPDLRGFQVLPTPDGYLLLVHLPKTGDSRSMMYVPGIASERVERGMLYGFDADGRARWDDPIEINDQYMMPSTWGYRLPALVFLGTVRETLPDNKVTMWTKILAIDKRSGRVVCKEKIEASVHRFRITGDPETATMTISLYRNQVTMKFTDQPHPEPALTTSKEPVDAEPIKPPKALWNALRRTITE